MAKNRISCKSLSFSLIKWAICMGKIDCRPGRHLVVALINKTFEHIHLKIRHEDYVFLELCIQTSSFYNGSHGGSFEK